MATEHDYITKTAHVTCFQAEKGLPRRPGSDFKPARDSFSFLYPYFAFLPENGPEKSLSLETCLDFSLTN